MTEDRARDGAEQQAERAAARSALDALPRLAQRRDEVLDRRRLGWIALIDAIVPTAAFVSWFLAQQMLGGPVRTRVLPTLSALVVMLLWDQLARGLRERYGANQAIRGVRRGGQLVLMVIGAGVFVLAFLITYARDEVPTGLVLMGAIAWIAGGLWIWGWMMRDARGAPRVPPTEHAVLTVAIRVATVCFGLGLGLIALVSPWVAAGGGFELLALLPALLALGIAGVGRFVHAVPALGASWRPPQWVAFGLSVAITCAAPILSAARPADGVVLGAAAAGSVLLLFVVAALWPAGADG